MLRWVGRISIIVHKSLLIGRPCNINDANLVIKDGQSCDACVPFASRCEISKYVRLESAAVILPGRSKIDHIVYTTGAFQAT